MSLSFQERFKDRVSAVGKQGEIVLSGSSPINKADVGVTFNFQKFYPAPAQTMQLPFSSFQPKSASETLQFVRPIRIVANRAEGKTEEDSGPNSRMTPLTVAGTEPAGLGQEPEEYRRVDMKASLASFGSAPTAQGRVETKPTVSGTEPRQLPPLPRPKRPLKQPKSAQLPQIQEEQKPPDTKKTVTAAQSEKAESVQSSPSQMLLNHKAGVEYTPYTLKDYRTIRTNKYLELGGLGAFMVGSEEWQKKKELHDRRKAYARQVLQSNSNKIAISLCRGRPEKSESLPSNSRQRALEFAKKIKPPVVRRFETEEKTVDKSENELDELEEKHSRLKSFVEEMRAKLLS